MTGIFQILERNRPAPRSTAAIADFVMRADDTSEDAFAVVDGDPHTNPYCLDHERRTVYFAQTPPQDLSDAPFYYQRQFETARRMIALPYERAASIAAKVPIHELIFICSIGRSGSTLLTKIWRNVPDTHSLSEPDVLTNIHKLHRSRRISDAEAAKLLDTVVRLVHRPMSDRRRLVIKPRSNCVTSAELWRQTFPAAKFVFIYRNLLDCVDSHLRVFGESPRFHAGVRYTPELEPFRELGRLSAPALNWLAGANHYAHLRQNNFPIVAIKYDLLISEPRRCIGELFAYCGVDAKNVEQACRALDQDAQAGTPLSRNVEGKRTIMPEESRHLTEFLRERCNIDPDAVLEGTLGV